MLKFLLYEDVLLLIDMPEEGVFAGAVGTVVDRHELLGKEMGYSVEFFDADGTTRGVITVPAHALRRWETND
jgi:hypothetical protein